MGENCNRQKYRSVQVYHQFSKHESFMSFLSCGSYSWCAQLGIWENVKETIKSVDLLVQALGTHHRMMR